MAFTPNSTTPLEEMMTNDGMLDGSEVSVYVLKSDDVVALDDDESKLIGMIQSFSESDSRNLPQVKELGTEDTITLMEKGQKSGQIARMEIQGMSLLRALFWFDSDNGGTDVETKEILSANNIIVVVDPESDDPDSKILMTDWPALGAIQNFTVQSSNTLSAKGEIGSFYRVIGSVFGEKAISLNRLVLGSTNVLEDIYVLAGYNENALNIDSLTEKVNIGILVYDSDGGLLHSVEFNGALPQHVSVGYAAGVKGVIDSVSFKWDKTKYGDGEVNQLWLDLDASRFRKPITLALQTQNSDGNPITRVFENVMIANTSMGLTQGSNVTVGSCSISWTKTRLLAKDTGV